jgi:hypothetical protein
MFELVGGFGWVTVAVVLILSVARVLVVAIALRGVPASNRAAVLRGLAECFRWWRGRNPKT